MSYINTSYNSVTRMTGLSGLDVDSLVYQLMQVEKVKVNSVSQSRQLLIWKQEQYREITSALQSFSNEYFNTLKAATDMRNSSIYNAFAVKYNGTDSNAYFTASAGAGAKAGSYTISNIKTAQTAKVVGSAAPSEIRGKALSEINISSEAGNNVFDVEFNGVRKSIVLSDGLNNIDDLVSDLQTKLDAAFGSGKIIVDAEANRLILSTNNTNTLTLSDTSSANPANGGLKAIGMDGVSRSNKLNLSANISEIMDSLAGSLDLGENEYEISFVINDQTFSFDIRTTSLNKIMAAVNSNANTGVRMSYDSLNSKFILESRQTGATARIMASDSNGGFLEALGLATEAAVTGRDASITYNDGVNGEQTITRSTNSFNINGITFNLQKDFEGAVEMSVNSDPTKAVELIKGFVEKYNELLDKINSKLSEKREYNYPPLTDDQKDAMTEDEIKRWEEKAKSGLLAGDSILRSIVTGLRNAVIEGLDGSGLTLASIGIKSNSWVDKGKLYVDEEKLKNALSENPTEVFNLFTKQSSVLYSTAVTDGSARTQRFNESGLIYRIYDVIQDNIRTTTIGGHRGALLENAGMAGDRSAYSNLLYSQILDYDARIAELNDELIIKENNYYRQFSQLETLINSMNTQSIWLAQQFG